LSEWVEAEHDATNDDDFGSAQELSQVEFPCGRREILAHDFQLGKARLNQL
jgi:hypothetical protein